MNSKYAFFTVDVERFADTECVANSDFLPKTDMMDGLFVYINILDKHGIKATMFALRETAMKHKDQLRKYIKNGHRLALHGERHVAPIHLEDNIFKTELLHAKKVLEETFHSKIIGYRAPFFGIDNNKLKLLQKIGFHYDSSCLNYSAARHTTAVNLNHFSPIFDGVCVNDNFYEFESSCENVFGTGFPVSGGGYIRLSNWLFARQLLKRYINTHNYYMFYLHPFELSKEKKPYIHGLKFYDKMYLG